MKYFSTVLAGLFLFCSLGMWGCTQQKAGVISAKIRDLETRYAKLEEDYRVVQANHEQNRKRLTQVESQRIILEQEKAELTSQLEKTAAEREEQRKLVAKRTAERDAMQGHLVQFSKDLHALAGRVETALNVPSTPNSAIVPVSRRSAEDDRVTR